MGMKPISMTRRSMAAGLGALLAGCKFYSDPPPVVVGGTPVSASEPIMAALRASSEHRRFTEALESTGLDMLLEGIGPFTVFAPTDAAFDFLRPKSAASQLREDAGILKIAMATHIVPARLTSEDIIEALPQLSGKTKVYAVNNEVISLLGDEDSLRLLDMRRRVAKIVKADAIARNGILHVIDSVLLPREEALVSP